RRAARIGPLIERQLRPKAKRDERRAEADEWREMGEQIALRVTSKWERKQEKRERKRDERERKREERRQRRWERWENGSPRDRLPWFVVLAVILGLTLAEVAVGLALRVIVPLVLNILSIVFGRALRDAAKSVSGASGVAIAGIRRARSAFNA